LDNELSPAYSPRVVQLLTRHVEASTLSESLMQINLNPAVQTAKYAKYAEGEAVESKGAFSVE
jgi:hypothetical protein